MGNNKMIKRTLCLLLIVCSFVVACLPIFPSAKADTDEVEAIQAADEVEVIQEEVILFVFAIVVIPNEECVCEKSGTGVLPTSFLDYTYSDPHWQDQLYYITEYTVDQNGVVGNGTILHAYSYDNIGNPKSDGNLTFQWEGKRLTRCYNGSLSANFTYDENGIRTQKHTNEGITRYYYNGTLLMGLTTINEAMYFRYDANGQVVSVEYKIGGGSYTEYYYLRNGQGDVVALLNSSGTKVVEYTYDTWGAPTSTTGSMAGTLGYVNPFRYRGYVYDPETNLYYCKSRYFDCSTGRFISPDAYMSTGQGVLGYNMYAYCRNNPVSREDTLGTADKKATEDEWEEQIEELLLAWVNDERSSGSKSALNEFLNDLAAIMGVSSPTLVLSGPPYGAGSPLDIDKVGAYDSNTQTIYLGHL